MTRRTRLLPSPLRRLLWGLAACLAWSAAARGNTPAELVFGPPEAPRALLIAGGESRDIAVPGNTPLGSLWKLFVHAYLADTSRVAPAYRCTGQDPAEEAYCCSPGGQIGADEALAKSCGLFFSPRRLGIAATEWRLYWRQRSPDTPAWLLDLGALEPATQVSVPSLLAALGAIDETSRRRTMAALLRVSLEPRARPLLSHLGSNLRVKTWSWRDDKGHRIGGFAGWLADGTPVWLRGRGTSAQVIETAAPWLDGSLPHPSPRDEACVQVRFFSRYPLSEILLDGRPAPEGALSGKVETRFANGQRLLFQSAGDLSLRRSGGQLRLEGRFGVNDYVARVVQREASPQPPQAARALAVAARTYLARHGGHGGGCYEIDDDSRAQRVSPAPASRAARAAADWSDGLVLNGVAGRYHLAKAGPRQMAWKTAVAWDGEGLRWDEILGRAYGDGGFGLLGEADAGECKPLPAAESWLAGQQGSWKRRLAGLPGFEAPSPLPRVCRLEHGNPYADIGRGRIYATGIGNANERLTVAHEYLHFALAHHPRGRDEDFVERTAHSLLGLP